MAEVDANVARTVAHLPDVADAVHDRAQTLGARARTILAQHRDTGAADIAVTQGRVDAFVTLEDEQAVVLEYGRPAGVSTSGRRYSPREGLYILHRTMGWR